ncbi:MAG: isoprenyl transferase [Myxococcota bacterium]|nr:isoprenyl transferase [Myxococcota bacterium]
MPRHLAIIMDGNGRWAQRAGYPRFEGHRRGADTVRTVVRSCRRMGIEALTLYAFSTQNWQRPAAEVQALMGLLLDYAVAERAEILENNIRFNCVGALWDLPEPVLRALRSLEAESAHNDGMVLSLALSYGGREDILQATRRLVSQAAEGRLNPEDVDADVFEEALWTQGLPADVDLVIRTSGERRISNFLLWQIAYSELIFTDVSWPEFSEEHLVAALRDFAQRDRRFGGLDPQSK